MFTILGSLALIFSIICLVFSFISTSEPGKDEYGDPTAPSPIWMQRLGKVKYAVVSFAISLILLLGLNGAFFIADGTEQYAVQYLWGTKTSVRTPGLHFKGWGKIIPVGNEIAVKYVIPDDETGALPENSDFTQVITAKEWEFNDAVKGEVAATVVINTKDMSDESFKELAFNVRSEKNLIYSRIVPAMNASLKTSAKLMGAQDYMSGKASDFDYYFKDQLINGAYRLEEIANKTGQESEVLDSVITTVNATKIEESSQPKSKSYVIMKNGGNIIRQDDQTVFSKYNIRVITATAEDVDWEDKFDSRLDKQKDLVAQIQERKRGAEKEYYARLEEEQKGEKEKVTEQKRLEKEQIQLTIAAETKVLTSKKLIDEERNRLEAQKLASQTLKVKKDAEAYANRKLVSAGLTPQERAEWEYKTAVGVAEQLSKLKLPQTVFTGSDNKSEDGILSKLIGAKLAQGMLKTSSGN